MMRLALALAFSLASTICSAQVNIEKRAQEVVAWARLLSGTPTGPVIFENKAKRGKIWADIISRNLPDGRPVLIIRETVIIQPRLAEIHLYGAWGKVKATVVFIDIGATGQLTGGYIKPHHIPWWLKNRYISPPDQREYEDVIWNLVRDLEDRAPV